VAEYLWEQGGSSCSKIWGFEDQVEDFLMSIIPPTLLTGEPTVAIKAWKLEPIRLLKSTRNSV
jgi:hypothetical protein